MRCAIFNPWTRVLSACDAKCKRACEVPKENVKHFGLKLNLFSFISYQYNGEVLSTKPFHNETVNIEKLKHIVLIKVMKCHLYTQFGV
jgi:hypothetical protein